MVAFDPPGQMRTVLIRWIVVLRDVNDICNQEKCRPCRHGSPQTVTDVTEDFIRYARPLIQGNIEVPLGEDGLPAFVYRK